MELGNMVVDSKMVYNCEFQCSFTIFRREVAALCLPRAYIWAKQWTPIQSLKMQHKDGLHCLLINVDLHNGSFYYKCILESQLKTLQLDLSMLKHFLSNNTVTFMTPLDEMPVFEFEVFFPATSKMQELLVYIHTKQYRLAFNK